MSGSVMCPGCRMVFEIGPEHLGMAFDCTQCGMEVVVPEAGAMPKTSAQRALLERQRMKSRSRKRAVVIAAAGSIVALLALGFVLFVLPTMGRLSPQTPQECLDAYVKATNEEDHLGVADLAYIEDSEEKTYTEEDREKLRDIMRRQAELSEEMMAMLKERYEIAGDEWNFDFSSEILTAEIVSVEGERALAKIKSRNVVNWGEGPEEDVVEYEHELRLQDGAWRINQTPT